MVELSCPGCGHHLRISSKFVGTTGKCKYCGEAIEVQAQMVATPADLDSTTAPTIIIAGDPMGLGTPLPRSQPVAPLTDDGLGCLFWGVAFFIPPVGLVWALLISPDHDQRGKGLTGSAVMLLIAIGTFTASYQLVSRMEALQGVDWTEVFESFVNTVVQAPVSTVTLHGVEVPLLKGLVLQSTAPVKLQNGTLQNVPPEQLSFYSGSVQSDYHELAYDYDMALMSANWNYYMTSYEELTDAPKTDLYGTVNGKEFYLRISETDFGAFVTFVTRTN